ncbi:xylulokinase [Celerinatantimonas diazotrophica]|uniref:Xylulose kinase n=1 Tax=Celerinatantimonas diazotrophica TaxID=412034 RepID=A0A4R1K4H3_9GAMM|nr:xylulokinase [Celerinatantimonas diazotrophica]TCK59036.1 xylulokinase [Celerinatantimonas diazotrophica]CAG9297671.1 Xylulose kinase [Celerinatantimonas diazotrophica]
MYLGIDLGTSAVKVIVIDDEGQLLAQKSASLSVQNPHPLFSEQDPHQWWQATDQAVRALRDDVDLADVKGIGLSGQMHGATLLDSAGEVLRPAILWNDGRSAEQCRQLEAQVPDSRIRTGNLMMPGFTAPKLLWVRQHEPELFKQVKHVLLPKDYLRYKMTGQFASDMSDAAGTMWLNLKNRDWDDTLLAATGLTREQMPKLYEGPEITGTLNPDIAQAWAMKTVPVVAGGGDNAAGALGVGITKPGQAMLSLGTSGVYFAVTDGVYGNPEAALHSFCHALPDRWHLMSVILSAASCLDWIAKITNYADVATMLSELEQSAPVQHNVIFLPYLSGERTPHNDPNATGVFFGLTHQSNRLSLVQAVLEGVSFAMADGIQAMHECGYQSDEITLIGGGAQSAYWRQLLADVLNLPLTYRSGGDIGPALGAARLAMLGCHPDSSIESCCPKPELLATYTPDLSRHQQLHQRRETFKALYPCVKELF